MRLKLFTLMMVMLLMTLQLTPQATTPSYAQGGPILVQSTFDSDDEGWTTVNDATNLQHIATGGNPGGHISADDVGTGEHWYWRAPSKFLGDISAAYKQPIQFDLKQSTTTSPATDTDDIILTGIGITLVFDTANDPGTDWTTYTVLLDETVGWKNQATGQSATQSEMLTVLSSLTDLMIRGEYSATLDTGGLDNVILIGSGTTLTCDDTEVYPGDTMPVDLIASGTDIYGGQVSCAVDPAIAQPQSALFGDFFTQPYLVGANQADAAAGTWLGAVSQQNPSPPVSGSGTLATVAYQAMGAGTTNVTCTPLFSDRDGFEIPSSASACTMTVLDYGSISGTLSYQGRLAHADIEVTATGPVTGTDLTDAAGDFLIEQLRGGSYDVEADAHAYLPTCTTTDVTSGQISSLSQAQLLGGDVAGDSGDDDGDGDYGDDVINIGDATLVSGAFGSGDAQADINADGTINVQDLSILGGNYELTGCQDW